MTQLPRALRQPPASAELAAALGACRRSFMAIALFSGMSNILMLTGSLFMLEVYDRVLPSRRVPTLVALLMLAGGLYAAQGIIDAIRRRILVRVGNSLDETLSLRVYDAIVRLRFLTPMTNAIIERKGTIDKYIGDAIMAFWNAPLGRRRAGSKCL
jgi:ABC-type protease/lipase transport system fused ATPase/permease subunit